MFSKPVNLVFEGGGVLGIAYLGVFQYLDQNDLLQNLKRTAGTSAGAITACLTSFHLPFEETKNIADSLDFHQVPEKSTLPDLEIIPEPVRNELEKLFGDYESVYRLMNHYGWYSSNYFYQWIKKQIACQFDSSKKPPPYTFSDFRNSYIHSEKRPFHDLYIIGTDLSHRSSKIFSYETTPHMEVAEAVRISMSIPLFFEAVRMGDPLSEEGLGRIFCDGGVMRNYPINLFDTIAFKEHAMPGPNFQTLGAKFISKIEYYEIDNLLSYIKNLYFSQLRVQQDAFDHSPEDIIRSIQIDTGNVSPVDFDITAGDETYEFLCRQGYESARSYFASQSIMP